ncbi:MAG TPA: GGDEF domain-containing protein, partial [Acidimicrobiia bacterium]|nr:GGDEF domain-containing protein [Acidimicrobiia bacterium]
DDGRIRYMSPAAVSLLARPASYLAGELLGGLVHPDDRAPFLCLIAPGDGPAVAELRLSHLQGDWVEVEALAAALPSGDGVGADGGVVLTLRDIRDRKAFEAELRFQALHDPLTGLANRVLFRDHVEHTLNRLRHDRGRPHAVIFFDLDGFKTINDSLGHAAGDEVLAELAGRVRAWLRPGTIAARLGGDEFAVLVENTTEADAAEVATRILANFDAPISVAGRRVVVSASVGVALSTPEQDAEELLRNADVAMFAAKTAGKARVEVFQPEMQRAVLDRLVLEADLRRAIEGRELSLAYQPIVEPSGGRMVAMEALARWHDPERARVPPAEFVAVAEDSGLIRPLGRWVLEEACRQLRAWDAAVPGADAVRLCVNVSVRELHEPGFVDEVAATLARAGVDAGRLTLEITESVLADEAGAVAVLGRLRDIGVRLALDDFGTGYSSLAYLRSLPIHVLKIDRSFVEGITLGPEASAVARATLRLARTFGLATVAEGVENAEQMAALAALGANFVQGYHISHPLDPSRMEAFLRRNLTTHATVRPGYPERAPMPAVVAP